MLANLSTCAVSTMGLSTLMLAAGAVARLLPISQQPVLLVGPGASARLAQAINDFGHRKVLIATAAVFTRLGLTAPL